MSLVPDSVRVKIERANHHVADLEVTIARFEPYTLIAEMNAEGRAAYRVSNLQPIPFVIPLIAGDVLQNLRTALDYLACSLWSRTNVGLECKVYFPITEDAAKYKTEGLRKIKGMGQDAIDAISALEPYGGGKSKVLWNLHNLSIIDKHRLLIAVTGANLGIHLPSLYPEAFPDMAKSNPWIMSVGEMRCPLEENDILFIDGPNRELKKDLKFPFFVAFDEVGGFKCQPLVPMLKQMAGSVSYIAESLALLFS